jgi:uncharacterized membrane protein
MLIIISTNDHGCAIEDLLALHSVLMAIKEALLLTSLLLGNIIAHHVIRVAPSRAADLVLLALGDTRLVSLALVFQLLIGIPPHVDGLRVPPPVVPAGEDNSK